MSRNSATANYMDDVIIHTYIGKLRETFKNESIGYLDSYVTELMVIKKITDDERAMKKWCEETKKVCDIQDKIFTIIPMLADGNHWIVSVIIPSTHHILLYDSFCGVTNRIEVSELHCIDKVKDFLCNYGRFNGIEHFYSMPWLTCPIPFDKLQRDKYTCGTFVLVIIHLFTVIRKGHVPTFLGIKNITNIHKFILREFSERREVNLLSEKLICENVLFESQDVHKFNTVDFGGSIMNSCSRGILRAISHPLDRTERESDPMDMSFLDKKKQNIQIIGEKRSVYSPALEFEKDAYIIGGRSVSDVFSKINRQIIENIAARIAVTVENQVMGEYREYSVEIFCDIKFGENFLLFERYLIQFLSRNSRGLFKIYLNVTDDGIKHDVRVPFHDYDHQMITDMVEDKRDEIHDIINANDAIYNLLTHNVHNVGVIKWKNWREWMAFPRTDSIQSVRILLLPNDAVIEEIVSIRRDFIHSSGTVFPVDPQIKTVLVSILLERERDEIYTQILYSRDPKKPQETSSTDDFLVADLACVRKFVYSENENEKIHIFCSQINHGILCDKPHSNRTGKTLLF